MQPISPHGPVKVAVTIDDLFLWDGTPIPDGRSPARTAREMTAAFAVHGIKGVYSFSSTAPAESDPRLYQVFDHWVEQGHHVANHTHLHGSLNWVDAPKYIADIERTEKLIGRWSSQAPTKYFRYCMDMWGNSREKRDGVEAFLQSEGFTSSPLSAWFYDHAWIVPFWRAHKLGDQQALAFLRKSFVDTAIDQLRLHTAAGHAMFGRIPPQIWLAHGSPIAGECMGQILDAFAAAGVEFISLEEAMSDPFYAVQPVITERFRNQTQKWAQSKSVLMPGVPPLILDELDNVAFMEGHSTGEVFHDILLRLCKAMDGEFSWPGWD